MNHFNVKKIPNVIFYASLCVFILVKTVHHITFFAFLVPNKVLTTVYYASMAVLVLSEIIAAVQGEKWTVWSFAGLFITIVLAANLFRIGRIDLMVPVVFVFCSRNKSLRTIFIIATTLLSAILLVTMLSAFAGVIENAQFASNGRIRFGLGFRYPLHASMLMLSITGMLLYLASKKTSWSLYLSLSIANTAILMSTGSRLSFGVAMGVIIVCAIVRYSSKGKGLGKIPSAILACLCILAASLAIGITAAYDPSTPWMAQLNAALGDRLRLGHDGLVKYGITVFGQKVKLVSNMLTADGQNKAGTYNFIDCVYMQYIIIHGLLYFAVFMALITRSCYKSFRSGAYILGIILIAVAMHGMIDNLGEYLWLNPALFALSGIGIETRECTGKG